MASVADGTVSTPSATLLAPDSYERALSAGAIVLLVCVVAAVIKGHAHWAEIPVLIWPHLLTIAVAVALTPVILLRRCGTRAHRKLGWVWVVAFVFNRVPEPIRPQRKSRRVQLYSHPVGTDDGPGADHRVERARP
jgi:hypothetical protein